VLYNLGAVCNGHPLVKTPHSFAVVMSFNTGYIMHTMPTMYNSALPTKEAGSIDWHTQNMSGLAHWVKIDWLR
jgi:hypothetical protein